MKALLLMIDYTGDDEKDFPSYLAAHHFIMDDRNSIKDRAEVLRDMTTRGLKLPPPTEASDAELVNTYVQGIADIW